MPNQPATPNSTFRIPLWVKRKANRKRKREGYASLTALINEWLLEYVEDEPDEPGDDE